jgi:uncharacterized protein with HEPN domain
MRRDVLLLNEMIKAAERAHELVGDLDEDALAADELRRDALLWNLTVLGEAAANLSDELKDAHADVPWRQPASLRNRIVHGYWSIDLRIIHTTAVSILPTFAEQLRQVLARVAAEP